ncbi:MAG: glucose-6-phosphate isomerase [Eubacteriales bacterium]|nr:glucose-6-phosphate isomerase [Eubacteriales bacterium]
MMNGSLTLDFSDVLLSEHRLFDYEDKIAKAEARLHSGNEKFTGWADLPLTYDRDELKRIKEVAELVRSKCDAFVLIGIGGSYLGPRAAIEMLAPASSSPSIYYAGQNLSGTYHKQLMEELADKEVCLCVISKSGTTTETSVAFALFKDWLYGKYGKEEARRRIVAITDAEKGSLRQEATEEGYETFVVPANIGGRYSVLSAVGLFPIACAGINIDEMLDGARDRAGNNEQEGLYAAARNCLYEDGKKIEVFEYYEPRLHYFAEWLKQLFGESEGKDGKGLFPAALAFSTDLHSMGQFLQEGSQIFFETILNVVSPPDDLLVPESAGTILANKSMNQINHAALSGVMAAHRAAGISMVRIDIPSLCSYTFGQMVYSFEKACALSGYLLGVDPFDQPGVEHYKAEMRKVLEK